MKETQLQKAARFMRAMRSEQSDRDWPQDLRVNAASIRLAWALHDARREAYNPSMLEFSALPVHIRRAYIETAAAILKATAPATGLPEDVQIGGLLAQLARQRMRVGRVKAVR